MKAHFENPSAMTGNSQTCHAVYRTKSIRIALEDQNATPETERRNAWLFGHMSCHVLFIGLIQCRLVVPESKRVNEVARFDSILTKQLKSCRP